MRYFFVWVLFASMSINGCNHPNLAESRRDVLQYLKLLEELHQTLAGIADGNTILTAAGKIKEIGTRLEDLKSKQTRIPHAIIEEYDPFRRKIFYDIGSQLDRLRKIEYGSLIVLQVNQLFENLSDLDTNK